MANNIKGKVWSLDTAVGTVTNLPVNIFSIRIRWTTAGVGSCILTTLPTEGVGETILDLKTTAASSAAAFILDAEYLYGGQYYTGLAKAVCVNVDTIYIVTGIPD